MLLKYYFFLLTFYILKLKNFVRIPLLRTVAITDSSVASRWFSPAMQIFAAHDCENNFEICKEMHNDNNSKGSPLQQMLTVLVRISNLSLKPVFFFTFFAITG